MNKKILLIVLTFSLVFIIAACGVEEYDITLKEDFSGSFINTSLMDVSAMSGEVTIRSNEHLLEEPKLKLISDEKLEQDVDGVKMIGNKRTFEFHHISDIPGVGFNIEEENDTVTVSAPMYGITESPEKLEESKKLWNMAMEAGYKARVSITLPGKVLETNAIEYKDNRASWDLMNKELLAQDKFWVRFEKEGNGADKLTEQLAEPAADVGAAGGIEEAAAFLESKGILKGSNKGLELDKELTRVEGALVYVRLIDLEAKIEEFKNNPDPNYIMPFNDVPDWAVNEIRYLNYAGLINGIAPDKFGSTNSMTADQLSALLLRAMGYSDAKGDFVWNKAVNKAVGIGMLRPEDQALIEKEPGFTRGEMSLIAFRYSQYKLIKP